MGQGERIRYEVFRHIPSFPYGGEGIHNTGKVERKKREILSKVNGRGAGSVSAPGE